MIDRLFGHCQWVKYIRCQLTNLVLWTDGQIFDGGLSLPQADGKDAEQADDDAENRHGAVAFAEADGGI